MKNNKSKFSLNSTCITKNIKVEARPSFIPNEKLDSEIINNLELGKNMFVYQIIITNYQKKWVRLKSRYWKIIDSEGEEKSINGIGVVGECPKLFHGESFSYSSFCPISTEWGTMEGWYNLEDSNKKEFKVFIKRFYLVKYIENKVIIN